MENKYKRVPITAAREVAKKYDKQEIVILAIDREFNKIHITTYGVSKHYCLNAEITGDFLTEVLGIRKPKKYFDLIEKIKELWKQHRKEK